MADKLPASSSRLRFPGLLISNLVFTDAKLGRGSDATVYAVEWNGTVCAGKRLHDALLEDESPGGADKLISNFEVECLTWSKLRHPGVVQFMGVYLERSSLLPVLVMEKMDTTLRTYLEGHSKEEFPLHQKAAVLHQVSQALAYLHSQNPPLVHHDLSTNNVLLNVVSCMAKISDFGMSRAINPSSNSRTSSIKGTPVFMAPEALQNPLRYNEKLDVFSFGNIIISMVTHEWPNPGPHNRHQGDQLVALNEFQRREHDTAKFTVHEKQVFLPIVNRCLENRPDKRPSSVELVQEMSHIMSTLPRDGHVAAPIEQLRQQLSAKEEECRQKDEALREKDEVVREKDEVIREKDEVVREKDEVIREKDEALREKDEVIREKDDVIERKNATIQEQGAEIQLLRDQLLALTLPEPVPQPPKDWRELGECKRTIQHRPGGGWDYFAVAVNEEGVIAVTDVVRKCVHLHSKDGVLVQSFGRGKLGVFLYGVAFDLKGNVWVSDSGNNKVVKLSQDGRLHTIRHASSDTDCLSDPNGVSVSPEGLIYICDSGNHRVTVHDEEGHYLDSFGSFGSGPGCFDRPVDIAFGSDGFTYVVDLGNNRVSVWSRDGVFERIFNPQYPPRYIAATADNHLLITSPSSHVVMVYSAMGELVHLFGWEGSDPGRLRQPQGICISDNVVYVVDSGNNRIQIFY